MQKELVDRLRTMLHNIFPEAKDVKSNTQVTINCPICKMQGDPDHGNHMYISLGADDKPPMFNCFRRSGHSGLLTKSNIEKLTNYSQYIDTDLVNSIQNLLNTSSQFNGYWSNQNIKRDVFLPKLEYTRISKEIMMNKLYYIKERVGLNEYTFDMSRKDKIILSLYDFLNANRIRGLAYDKGICDIIEYCFVGFLTSNNTSIIFRNWLADNHPLKKKSKIHNIRYMSYKIVPNSPTGYYIIPTECDILKHIDIHIAEGAFDILSICYNLMNDDRKNKIYAAIGSKAYINLIKFFMTTYGLIDITYHVYIDSTIESSIIDEIKRLMNPLDIEIWIHINTFKGEKDFGVPKERISDYYYKL